MTHFADIDYTPECIQAAKAYSVKRKKGVDRAMRKKQIHKIVPHIVPNHGPVALSEQLADLHIQVIEGYLNRLNLSKQQRLAVINLLIKKRRP